MILRFTFAAALLAGLAACNDTYEDTRPLPNDTTPTRPTPPPSPPSDLADETDEPTLRPGVPVNPVPPEVAPGQPLPLPSEPVLPSDITGEMSAFDRDFITKAAIGGRFEVQSSQMALERASDPATIEFAQMMIDDHSKANDKLAQVARSKGIELPTQLDAKHSDLLNQLSAQETPEGFSQRYHEIQVTAHEEAIKLFEQAAAEARDSDIKKFASDALPTLRLHLDHLRQHVPGPGEEPR